MKHTALKPGLLKLVTATLVVFSCEATAQVPVIQAPKVAQGPETGKRTALVGNAAGLAEEANFSSDLVFDAEYYLEKQPDVNRFYNGNKKAALVHWLGDGIKQGRDASPTFSVKYYMKKYPDVPATNREAIAHWLKVGVVEGRQGSEFFDPKVYLETVKGKLPNPSYATAIRHYQSLPKEKQVAYVKVDPPKGSPLTVANPLRIGVVEPVKGTVFCDIDDRGTIFVNGIKIHTAGMGFSRSGEVTLKPSDRLVIQLASTADPRYCKVLFVSSDKKQMINFGNTNFKILPDPDSNDFEAAAFGATNKFAKDLKKEKNPFPYKNQSEYVWGDLNICAIGAVITKEMFVPLKL